MDPETQQDVCEILVRIKEMFDTALVADGHKKRFGPLTMLCSITSFVCLQCGETASTHSIDFGAIVHMNEEDSVRTAIRNACLTEHNITSKCIGTCIPSEQYHDHVYSVSKAPDQFLISLVKISQDRDHLTFEIMKVTILIMTNNFIKCNNVANITRNASS